jgi:hypothetical protein
LIVKVNELKPSSVTVAVLGWNSDKEMRLAEIVARISVLLIHVCGTGEPFHNTRSVGNRSVPRILKVKAGAPAVVALGISVSICAQAVDPRNVRSTTMPTPKRSKYRRSVEGHIGFSPQHRPTSSLEIEALIKYI